MTKEQELIAAKAAAFDHIMKTYDPVVADTAVPTVLLVGFYKTSFDLLEKKVGDKND